MKKLPIFALATSLLSTVALAQNVGAPAPRTTTPAPAPSDIGLGPGSEPLADAILVAARSYPSVAAARSNARAARSNLQGARWLRFPSASVEAVSTGTGTNETNFALSVEQPIWTAGRISGNIRLSRAQLDAAISGVSETELEVSLRVVAAYFEVQRLMMREAILQDSLTEHRKLVESMTRRVAQELSPFSDLELARSRSLQVEQDYATALGAKRAALARLRELTGNPGYEVARPMPYNPAYHHPDPKGLFESALEFDPRRRRLQAEAKAANADVAVKRAGIFPQLNAQYQKPVTGDDKIGLILRAQTDGGFAKISSVSAARERREAAELQIAAAERELREVISAELVENEAARTRVSSGSQAADSAKSVTDSFMRQFVAGKRTWFDVMNAVRESVSARLAESEARTIAMSSAARLLLRSGRWQPGGNQEWRP